MSKLFVDNIASKTGGTNSTALSIDVDNVLTKPQLPHFFLQGTSNSNVDVGSDDRFGSTDDGQTAYSTIAGGASINRFTYNTATGQITVPVTGVYMIGGTFWKNEANQAVVALQINGTNRVLEQSGNDDDSCRIQVSLKLNANDLITFVNKTGAGRNFYEGETYSYVYGHLIG